MENTKTCTKCGKQLPLDQFYKCGLKSYQSSCKNCLKNQYLENRADRLSRAKEYYKKNRKKIIERTKGRDKLHPKTATYYRGRDLAKKYGITLNEYDKLLTIQNERCAICGASKNSFAESLSVDHDHTTGEVRGLLCRNCNLLLGCARDDVATLVNAIKYLKRGPN